jgi:hypothetical protein
MKELSVFFSERKFDKIITILFYPENFICTRYNYVIRKDFKLESVDTDYLGYYLELQDKNILNLKQFKIEVL